MTDIASYRRAGKYIDATLEESKLLTKFAGVLQDNGLPIGAMECYSEAIRVLQSRLAEIRLISFTGKWPVDGEPNYRDKTPDSIRGQMNRYTDTFHSKYGFGGHNM